VARVEADAGGLLVELEGAEASVLRSLIAEMREVLGTHDPQNPVRNRLFPKAYEDEEAAGTYRELVGPELEKDKIAALETVEKALGSGEAVRARIEDEAVEEWLRALTDMRLALGTRLEVDEEKMSAELDPDDPDGPALAILHWLGWLQGSMLEAGRLGGE
jgi:hypothetical protein